MNRESINKIREINQKNISLLKKTEKNEKLMEEMVFESEKIKNSLDTKYEKDDEIELLIKKIQHYCFIITEYKELFLTGKELLIPSEIIVVVDDKKNDNIFIASLVDFKNIDKKMLDYEI